MSFILQINNSKTKCFALLIILFFLCIRAGAQVDVTATEGTTNFSYTTVKDAFDAINAGTHQGAIAILVTGTTNETAMASLRASGTGAALYTGVTIHPSGTAAITGNIDGGAVLQLNGADNITIDGLGGINVLAIENTSTSSASGTSTIRFANDATGNILANCTVNGSSTCSVAGLAEGGTILFGAAAAGGNGNDNNTVTGCNIGPAGSNLPTRGIGAFGTIANDHITISDCNIFDFFSASSLSRGIDIGSGNSDWIIQNNRLYQTAARTQISGTMHRIISVDNTAGNNFLIAGNSIGFASSAGTGKYTVNGTFGSSLRPIYLAVGSATVSVVDSNIIAGISIAGNISGAGTSAIFSGVFVHTGLVNITKNRIGFVTGTGSVVISSASVATSEIFGVYHLSSNTATINANRIGSFSVSNSNSGSMAFYGIRTNTATGTPVTINNNIIGSIVAPGSVNNSAAGSSSRIVGIQNDFSLNTTINDNMIANLTMAGANTGTGTSASMIGINQAASSALLPSTHMINGNIIHSLSNTNVSAGVIISGIVFSGASPVGTSNNVSGNFIHSFSLSTTSSLAEMRGIQALSGVLTNYTNNMIRLGIDAAGLFVSGPYTICGILESGGGGFATGISNNFFFNSIFIGGNNVTGSSNTYAFRSLNSAANRSYRNNIFFNARSNSSGTGKHYAVQLNGAGVNPAGLTCNNNIFYSFGTGGVLGLYGGIDRITLADWQAALAQDANSFYTNPFFKMPAGSAASLDLHINGSLAGAINDIGIALPGVTVDYDNQMRNATTPDIGADEFAGPTCNGSNGGTASVAVDSFCGTDSTIITATGYTIGATTVYEWESSPDSFTSEPISTGQTNPGAFNTGSLSATTYYRLKVTCGTTSATGYSNIVTITVTPSAASILASATSVCAGESVTLTENGGTATGWSWTPGGASTKAITVTPSSTTQYTVSAISGSCSANAGITVTVNPLPAGVSASASVYTLCDSGRINLFGNFINPSPTILSERFNDVSNNWTAINNSTGGTSTAPAWTVRPNNYLYGGATFTSNDASPFYLSNSDAQGNAGVTNTELMSPVFSTVGYTDCSMRFYHYFRYGFSGDSALVEVSTNGTVWTTLKSFTASAGSAGGFVQQTINLNDYTGNGSVYIRFRYTASWDWYWAIDNVSITGTPTLHTFGWTSSPAGFVSGDQNPENIALSSATDYIFTVTNSAGCSSSSTTTVTVDPELVPLTTPSGNVTIDADDSLDITVNDTYSAYLWSTGETTKTINVDTAGSYIVTVTYGNGCTGSSEPVVVTVDTCSTPIIGASGSTTNVCPQNTVTLGTSLANSYLWSNGDTTRFITVSAAGNYSVTTTNGACIKTSVPKPVTYRGCPAPTNPVVSNITPTSTRLSWTPPASCAIGYLLQYRKSSDIIWTTIQLTASIRTVTGLLPNTTYQWRVLTGCRVTPPIGSGYVNGPGFTTAAAGPAVTDAHTKFNYGNGSLMASVFPNPAKNNAILQLSGNTKEITIRITDVAGKVLWHTRMLNALQARLPVEQLSSGMYFVTVTNEKESRVVKFIKE